MPSVVDLCNVALARLGEEPIVDLSETVNGQRCNRLWPTVRDEVLRADDWRFALTRTNLAASADAPNSIFSYAYPYPSDLIRLVALKTSYDWSTESNSILTNQTSPLYILYIRQVKDPNEYPSDFFSACAYRLAIELSGYLTTTAQAVNNLTQLYQNSLSMAVMNNGRETPEAAIPDSTWILARHGIESYDYFGDNL